MPSICSMAQPFVDAVLRPGRLRVGHVLAGGFVVRYGLAVVKLVVLQGLVGEAVDGVALQHKTGAEVDVFHAAAQNVFVVAIHGQKVGPVQREVGAKGPILLAAPLQHRKQPRQIQSPFVFAVFGFAPPEARLFVGAAFDLRVGELLRERFAQQYAAATEYGTPFAASIVAGHKMAVCQAVGIQKQQIIAFGGYHGAVHDDGLAEAVVVVKNMLQSVRKAPPEPFGELGHLGSGAIVGQHHFKVGKRLPGEAEQGTLEQGVLSVAGNDYRYGGGIFHATKLRSARWKKRKGLNALPGGRNA
jgi:hypothetical protein